MCTKCLFTFFKKKERTKNSREKEMKTQAWLAAEITWHTTDHRSRSGKHGPGHAYLPG
jgi:hypothetical protein